MTVLCARFHTFSSHHLEQVARALIEAKANLEVQNIDQATALNVACYKGHEESAILLLRAGARADVVDRFGDTPKSLAQQKGLEDVLALM